MSDILESLISNSPGLLRAAVISGYILNDFLPRSCFWKSSNAFVSHQVKNERLREPYALCKDASHDPVALAGISPAIASSVAGLFLSRLLRYCVTCLPFFCGELTFPRRPISVQERER